jgi:hypothetical protein
MPDNEPTRSPLYLNHGLLSTGRIRDAAAIRGRLRTLVRMTTIAVRPLCGTSGGACTG